MKRHLGSGTWFAAGVVAGGGALFGLGTHAADSGNARAETVPAALQTITLGAGCFWCTEAVFQEIPGVAEVLPGYMGGHVANPSYERVCEGDTGHAEVARIRYDPGKVSLDRILEVFWAAHDPTTPDRQGADVGTQYRSAIFYETDAQKAIAERSKAEASRKLGARIVTEIARAETFYPAENYHRDYYRRNKDKNPYCRLVIEPKLAKARRIAEASDAALAATNVPKPPLPVFPPKPKPRLIERVSPMKSEAEPPAVRPATGKRLAPPAPPERRPQATVRLLDEKGRLMTAAKIDKIVRTDAEWRRLLTPEQYDVARGKGTEPAFCGAFYDNHESGLYSCVCCGLPLFASSAKFDSGTGWPSFLAPVAPENVARRLDLSAGMRRTEVLCARCDAHLGHVFDDGPPPTQLRYCLNSVSLTFTPGTPASAAPVSR